MSTLTASDLPQVGRGTVDKSTTQGLYEGGYTESRREGVNLSQETHSGTDFWVPETGTNGIREFTQVPGATQAATSPVSEWKVVGVDGEGDVEDSQLPPQRPTVVYLHP